MPISITDQEHINKNPLVSKVDITDTAITVFTKKCNCSSVNVPQIYPIPECRIVLRTDGRTPKFRIFLKNKNVGLWGIHPHSFEKGGLCLGNLKKPIYKLLKDKQYTIAIYVLLEFLQKHNYGNYTSYMGGKEIIDNL